MNAATQAAQIFRDELRTSNDALELTLGEALATNLTMRAEAAGYPTVLGYVWSKVPKCDNCGAVECDCEPELDPITFDSGFDDSPSDTGWSQTSKRLALEIAEGLNTQGKHNLRERCGLVALGL